MINFQMERQQSENCHPVRTQVQAQALEPVLVWVLALVPVLVPELEPVLVWALARVLVPEQASNCSLA